MLSFAFKRNPSPHCTTCIIISLCVILTRRPHEAASRLFSLLCQTPRRHMSEARGASWFFPPSWLLLISTGYMLGGSVVTATSDNAFFDTGKLVLQQVAGSLLVRSIVQNVTELVSCCRRGSAREKALIHCFAPNSVGTYRTIGCVVASRTRAVV